MTHFRPCIRRISALVLLATFVGLVSSCSPAQEESSPGQPQVDGQPLSVAEEASLVLGAAAGDPAQEFFRVRTPFLLPNGDVVVPLASAGELRVFSQEGALLATLGRHGEGPGEFSNLLQAWSRGDTIETFDRGLMRVTRFLPDGGVETVQLDADGAGYRPDSAIPGPLGDGWAVLAITGSGYGYRDEVSIFRFARDGMFAGRVASTEGIFRYSSPEMTGPSPLSPSAVFALMGNALYMGETLTPAIQVVDESGAVKREIRWEPEPQPAPGRALQEVIRAAVEQAGPDRAESARKRLEAAPVPEAVPLFSTFLVDDLGFVWVRPYVVERDAAALGGPLYAAIPPGGLWWIFSADGERLGSVAIPSDLEPQEITASAVVGIRRDELGLEYVQVHRVQRR